MSKLLSIRTYGDPILREPSRPVEAVTPEIRTLVEDMFHTMKASQGIGLAAQQIGRTEAVCVVEIPEDYDYNEETGERLNPDTPLRLTLINPEIVEVSSRKCGIEEGCLSFPGITGNVNRPWAIVVNHLDLDGQPRATRLQGLLARAVQHEMDHLAGDLFIDRFSHVKKLAVRSKLKRLEEETINQMATV